MMPLNFYIAPFRWYKANPQDAYKYASLVIDALNTWQSVSGGCVSFNIVDTLLNSHVNLDWKRVDRKSLGYCSFNQDPQGRYYSAEVYIGLSDGIMCKKYMDEAEVYHTILHEIGHALGLGHSPNKSDIMYTPHQYGVVNLSNRDAQTLRWLYKLPAGKTAQEHLSAHSSLHATDLDDLVMALSGEKTQFEQTKDKILSSVQQKDLQIENQNIGDLKMYLMQIHNNFVVRKPQKPPEEPPSK